MRTLGLFQEADVSNVRNVISMNADTERVSAGSTVGVNGSFQL